MPQFYTRLASIALYLYIFIIICYRGFMKKYARSLATAASLTLIASCGSFDRNYEGSGNEFTIRGPITDVGEKSIKIYPKEVLNAEGAAEGWFSEDAVTQVHNNYGDSGCNDHEVDYQIIDEAGNPEGLDMLQEGDWVEIQGRIRESKKSCGDSPSWGETPVFDEVHEILR